MANAFTTYLRESSEELRKVAWPTRQTVIRDTGIVLAACVLLAVVFGGLDFGLSQGFAKLIELTASTL